MRTGAGQRAAALLVVMGGILVGCAPLSADGSGATVAPGSMSDSTTDRPAFVQRYPCGGAQATCWGVPSW
jgi:hypothetical protein